MVLMENFKILWAAVFVVNIVFVSGLRVISLNGTWVLNDSDGVYKDLKGTVPGGIYTDLMNNKIIGDVFYGSNDTETRWVAKMLWQYSNYFQIEDKLNYEHQNLVFDGLDTFSKIYLNGALVGSSENMFVRYKFDVKQHLRVGLNNLTVLFASPIDEAKRLYTEQSKNYTVKPTCVPFNYRGECHVNHIRKMQASFAWDWGPAFPSVGIWKNVYIRAYNSSIINDVLVHVNDDSENWQFSVTTFFEKNNQKTLEGTLIVTIFTDMGKTKIKYSLSINGNGEFVDKRNISLPKQHFRLWWPNGMGEQPLYRLRVTYVSPNNLEQSNKRIRVGIRKIELIQDQLDIGRDFYFKVNGRPFFAKGTNMIPVHILPELANNETRIRFLLQSSKDVHMNMIRIWGGGMYEADALYDIADELGILIWQDFMFACSMYPVNQEFLSTVKEEVKQQVRRLQHHPSISLWAGNNENEAALRQNWYGTSSNFEQYKSDYVKLYVDTVKEAVFEIDESAIYITSSPTNGVESDSEGHVAQNPQDPLYGDIHFYNYAFDGWDKNDYPITRFASEYGYQAIPSIKSLLTATNKSSNLSIHSDFMLHRQHHLFGYLEMQNLISYRLKLPGSFSANYNRALIFYSQIYQAMAVKQETEYYRQWRNFTNDVGRGRTMGALYWQLNDVWIAPTWSSIDFNNNWKMLHYYAKDFFAPIIMTFHIKPDGYADVYIVSDDPVPKKNAIITVFLYRWDSFRIQGEIVYNVNINEGSMVIDSLQLEQYFNASVVCGDVYEAPKNCFFYSFFENGIGANNTLLPAAIKNTSIQNATVTISNIIKVENNVYDITINTDYIAAFVWLECDIRGRFSDNGFFQVVNEKVIRFNADEPTSTEEISRSLTVTHLRDSAYL